MKCRDALWIVIGLSALLSGGCSGEEGEPTYPVTGTVTRNGQPLEGAVVSFVPQQGKPAVAVTDAAGKYSLTTKSKDDGAVIGTYKVTILKYDRPIEQVPPAAAAPAEVDVTAADFDEYPDSYNEMAESAKSAAVPKNILPPQYANPDASGLTAEVTEGENVFDFKVDG